MAELTLDDKTNSFITYILVVSILLELTAAVCIAATSTAASASSDALTALAPIAAASTTPAANLSALSIKPIAVSWTWSSLLAAVPLPAAAVVPTLAGVLVDKDAASTSNKIFLKAIMYHLLNLDPNISGYR